MDPFSGALFAGLGVIMLMAGVLPMILMVFALVYVALRVRDAKAETPDPDLGLKSAYWFLYTLGILVLHFGLMVLFTHWFQQIVGMDNRNQFRPNPPIMVKGGFVPAPANAAATEEWSAESRTGWALVLAGGLIAGAFYTIGAFGTRDRQWPTVRRVFVGGRLAVAGMFTIFAFVALVVLQFQKDVPPGSIFPTTLATLAVWVPSLAIHIFLFRWGGDPAYHVPDEPRRRRPTRPYEEEEHTEADLHVEPPTEEEEKPDRRPRTEDGDDTPKPDDEEERPRRRRPRDDDE